MCNRAKESMISTVVAAGRQSAWAHRMMKERRELQRRWTIKRCMNKSVMVNHR